LADQPIHQIPRNLAESILWYNQKKVKFGGNLFWEINEFI